MDTCSQVESVTTGSRETSRRLKEFNEIDEIFSNNGNNNSGNDKTNDEER